MSASGDELVWYFAYASSMNDAFLRTQIGSPDPADSVPVIALNAWLSFDYVGIPFIDPAYASLIVKNLNDGPFADLSEEEKTASLDYRRYIHERCYPGIPFTPPGDLPPPVEGMAFRIQRVQLQRLARAPGFKVAKVECQRFTEGDASQRIGEVFQASALVALDSNRSPRLMPGLRTFGSIYRGALTHCFSTRYLRYLVLLRPYNVDHGTRSAQIAQKLFAGMVLFPQFLLLYYPLAMFQKYILGSRLYDPVEALKGRISNWIRWTAVHAERWIFRPVFGDVAYRIDED